MAKVPVKPDDLWQFIEEIPYRTANEHGQRDVDKRYIEYAGSLEARHTL